MAQPARWQRNFSFGGRVPWAVGLLIGLTAVLSLLAAFVDRHGAALFAWTALAPAEVWRGQVWRLATWFFFEPSPLGLIFNCLMFFWFGPQLAGQWGSRRFITVFGAVMLATGIGTCLIGLVDPLVFANTYLGGTALSTAMVVTWGLWFPDSVIRIYFVIPIRAYWVAWLTVAVTVIYAMYSGWTHWLPELLSEASVLLWMYRATLVRRWKGSVGSFASGSKKPSERRGVVVDFTPRDRKDREPN
jgi:membrane associated rhomboid family serine protease